MSVHDDMNVQLVIDGTAGGVVMLRLFVSLKKETGTEGQSKKAPLTILISFLFVRARPNEMQSTNCRQTKHVFKGEKKGERNGEKGKKVQQPAGTANIETNAIILLQA